MSELKSTKFKIGDKVKIAESSLYYVDDDNSNPKDCAGVIVDLEEYEINVKWENGYDNVYIESDLILVNMYHTQPTKDKDTFTENSIDHFKTLTQKNDVTIMFENGQMKLFWQEFEYIVLDDIELEKVLQAINTLEELRDKMA